MYLCGKVAVGVSILYISVVVYLNLGNSFLEIYSL